MFRAPATRDSGFVRLMETYQERLYWHIRKIVTFHDDADDALQNTFLKAWQALDNFRGDSGLYTWLYRIATNESLMVLQQRKKRAADSIEMQDTLANRLRADRYFDGEAADIMLQEAIDTLPDKQRVVFAMRYFDATPYEEMSTILDTSVGALKASYHHAVKKVESFVISRLNQS